jgi:hypothetical protein
MTEATSPDPAGLLQKVYMAGFELQTLGLYPKAIAVVRGEYIALLVPDATTGLQLLGRPGIRVGENVGVLTTAGCRKVFQWKGTLIEATEERLAELRRFEADLAAVLGGEAGK